MVPDELLLVISMVSAEVAFPENVVAVTTPDMLTLSKFV